MPSQMVTDVSSAVAPEPARGCWNASSSPTAPSPAGAMDANPGGTKGPVVPPAPVGGDMIMTDANVVGEEAPQATGDGAPQGPEAPKREAPQRKALPPPSDPGFLGSVQRCIEANVGTYKQGRWERKPWDPRPFAVIDDYLLPDDVPEPDATVLLRKLRTTLPEDWRSQDTEEALEAEHPGILAAMAAAPQVPLTEGVDMEQVNLWGMDGHTRAAVNDVLRHVPGMDEGDNEAEAEALRTDFIERRLLPAANALGERGWDMVAALESVGAAAEAEGDAVRAAAAAALVRVIVEVDEKEEEKKKKTEQQRKAKGVKEEKLQPQQQPLKRPRTAADASGRPRRAGAGRRGAAKREAEAAEQQELEEVGQQTDTAGDEQNGAQEPMEEAAGVNVEEQKGVPNGTVDLQEDTGPKEEEGTEGEQHEVREEEEEEQAGKTGDSPEELQLKAEGKEDEKRQEQQQLQGGEEQQAKEEQKDPATMRKSFRLHPKGVGVICTRPGGVPAGTLVADYRGEVYPPWRWYERQDALKKLNPSAELPDFYNIMLELPSDEGASSAGPSSSSAAPESPAPCAGGYDVVFIEAATKSTVTSRLSHSCAPNCVTIPTVRGGRHMIAMYTARAVAEGEELCWDYACVTESLKEYQAAVCLCGSARCRGSFLHYAGTGAFADVLNVRHGFLDRNALLVRAVTEPLEASDLERLGSYGVRHFALTIHRSTSTSTGADAQHQEGEGSSSPGPIASERCPDWLIKWASLVAEYSEHEKVWIQEHLLANPRLSYSPEAALIEAAGVQRNRLFNIVTTLDKIKYCLRPQPCPSQAGPRPPLEPLSPAEVCEHLWNGGASSVAARGLAALRLFLGLGNGSSEGRKGKRGGGAPKAAGAGSAAAAEEAALLRQSVAALEELVSGRRCDTPADASDALREFSLRVRFLGPEHHALADVLLMYAATQRWYRAVSIEVSVKSPPVSFEGDDRVPQDLAKGLKRREDLDKVLSRRYGGQYHWGQLVSWFKQTIYSPEASLSAERRGTMSLPDPESAYGNPRVYAAKQRGDMLHSIAETPHQYFPTSWIWSFKNPGKVYGSPQLDAAVARALRCPESDPLPALLEELRGAGPCTRSGGDGGSGGKRRAASKR